MAHEQCLSASALVETASCREKQAEWMFFLPQLWSSHGHRRSKEREPKWCCVRLKRRQVWDRKCHYVTPEDQHSAEVEGVCLRRPVHAQIHICTHAYRGRQREQTHFSAVSLQLVTAIVSLRVLLTVLQRAGKTRLQMWGYRWFSWEATILPHQN